MLLSAENVSKTFGSLRAVAGADLVDRRGRDHRPDRPERRRQVDLLQLPRRRHAADHRAHHLRRRRRDARLARGACAARHRAHVPGAGDVRGLDRARQRHGRRLPAPPASGRGARACAVGARPGRPEGSAEFARAQPRHARAQATRDRARARDRPAPDAARRGARRADAGRAAAGDRAGAQDPPDRRDAW